MFKDLQWQFSFEINLPVGEEARAKIREAFEEGGIVGLRPVGESTTLVLQAHEADALDDHLSEAEEGEAWEIRIGTGTPAALADLEEFEGW